MKLIYVCSPFRANETTTQEEHVNYARNSCAFVVSTGNVPIAPHLLFPQFMDDSDPEQRALAIEMNKELIEMCDELWYFLEMSGGFLSEGMKAELAYARELRLNCFERCINDQV
jgi:hypothetical protein